MSEEIQNIGIGLQNGQHGVSDGEMVLPTRVPDQMDILGMGSKCGDNDGQRRSRAGAAASFASGKFEDEVTIPDQYTVRRK